MVNKNSHLWPGVPLALGSALLFGLTAPLSKFFLADVDPQLLAGTLYLGAGLGLAVYRLGRRALKQDVAPAEAPLRCRDLPWLAAVVVAGGLIGPLLLMLGLNQTSAASASLLLNLEGLATMAIAWIVFRENVDARLLAGAFAILVGAVVLSWRGGGVALDRGALLVAGACLCWGVDNNLTRKLSFADPVVLALIKGIAAGGVNVGAAFLRGAAASEVLFAAAALGFFGVGVSLVLFILALRHLGTARTGAYFSLSPFIGALAAVAFLHEEFSARLLGAGALMAVGVWLHLSERHDHEHAHEVFEHDHAHVHDDHHRHAHEKNPVAEPHAHPHRHEGLVHAHPHYPDLHHRHRHE